MNEDNRTPEEIAADRLHMIESINEISQPCSIESYDRYSESELYEMLKDYQKEDRENSEPRYDKNDRML